MASRSADSQGARSESSRWKYRASWAGEGSPFGNVIGAGIRTRLLAHSAAIGVVHDFTPGLSMDLRIGYNRFDQRLNPISDEGFKGLETSLDTGADQVEKVADYTYPKVTVRGLKVTVEGPTFDTSKEGAGVPVLDAVASRSADGSEIYVKAVNTSPMSAVDTEMSCSRR